MPFTTLITASHAASARPSPDWVVIDCRFRLSDPAYGRRAHAAGHIPGAVYAHLNDDLSGPVVPGQTGRHPLPDPQRLAYQLGRWGVHKEAQVVAYDDLGGAIASRLWWLLRWLGHRAVAVLDGGWDAWTHAGLPIETVAPVPASRRFTPHLHPHLIADADEVAAGVPCLLDARAAERYRGEHEPIDPVAGHIPGALNTPFKDSLTAAGFMRSPEALRTRFGPVLAGRAPEDTVVYCGSGVTACHVLLAMAHAGLEGARLYPGSWSEWIAR
ncbi:MAG: sulfurtransferase [Bacteroidota bacterium]